MDKIEKDTTLLFKLQFSTFLYLLKGKHSLCLQMLSILPMLLTVKLT